MKIATIVQDFPSNRSYSYIRFKALSRNGQSVRIYYRAGAGINSGICALTEEMRASGVHAVLFRSRSIFIAPSIAACRYLKNAMQSGLSLIQALRYLRRVSKIVSWNPDVIHIEELFNARQLMGLLRLLGVPIVLSLRGDDICHKPKIDMELARWFRDADKIDRLEFHCISEYVKQCGIQQGISEAKLTRIYQGVDCIAIPESNEASVRCDTLVLIARLSAEKGVDVALEAMRYVTERCPGVMLHVFGSGELHEAYQREYGEQPFFKNVLFHDEIQHYSLRSWLRERSHVTIGLQPSRREGLGQAILELMATGIPVIASNVGGIPEIVEDHKNGILVEPDQPEQLGRFIVKLVEDPELASRLGAEAARSVRRFDDDTEGENFTEYYKALIDRYAD